MSDKCYVWSVRDTGADVSEASIVAHGACSSYTRALSALACWCRSQWAAQGHFISLPEDDAGVVNKYFDFWTPEEEYDIEELTLDEGVSQ